MNSLINDYYNGSRFNDIYIFGEERYKNIFLVNLQVSCFVGDEKQIDIDNFGNVLVPYWNKKEDKRNCSLILKQIFSYGNMLATENGFLGLGWRGE